MLIFKLNISPQPKHAAQQIVLFLFLSSPEGKTFFYLYIIISI